MSFHAANPASFSHLSPRPVEQANKSFSTRNFGGELCPSYGGHASSNRIAIAVNFRSQCASDNFALARVCRYVSRPLLGHSFGAIPAPGGTRSSASATPPRRGHGSSQKKFERRSLPWFSNLLWEEPRPRRGAQCEAEDRVPPGAGKAPKL